MASPFRAPTPRPPGLAQRLHSAADTIERVPSDAAAVVRLAQAWNGFYIARTVAVLLDAEAVPHRDAYGLSEDWCTRALDALYDVVEWRLVRRYCPDHAVGKPFLDGLAVAGQFELGTCSVLEIDRIAAGMIALTGSLHHLLTGVAGDEAALPDLRAAARAVAPGAYLIWSHYGGDAGGW